MAGFKLTRKERKEIRREEATQRNAAYKTQISTVKGIEQYIDSRLSECGLHTRIGAKQYDKLMAQKDKLNKK